MFSEYASRFLAHSQTRMSALRDGRRSLYPANNAPLFFSAADYPPEDREHDQEVSAIYALQRSRRHIGTYAASIDNEEDEARYSQDGSVNEGIRSSWNPEQTDSESQHSEVISNKMVEISLGDDGIRQLPTPQGASTSLMVNPNNSNSRELADSRDRIIAPIQRFRSPVGRIDHVPEGVIIDRYYDNDGYDGLQTAPIPEEEANLLDPNRVAQDFMTPRPVDQPPLSSPVYDILWTKLYGISTAGMVATSFIVWLHTDTPSKSPMGDSIYVVLHKAFPLLAVDTVTALFIAVVWMMCLKYFIRPLFYLLIVFVPLVMLALTIYPLVISYGGTGVSGSFQDQAMRVASFIPAIMSCIWISVLWGGRNHLHRAVGILQLALKIFAENPALLLCSLLTLISTILLSWVWLGMFVRIFLNGNSRMVQGRIVWFPTGNVWVLAVYFVCEYLWTLCILSNLQRVIISATVSHWYFYRQSSRSFSPRAALTAAIFHASTTMFGTICFSSFISLMIRLPLLLLPGRFGRLVHMFCFNLIASPINALTNPLTITYAAVHSSPLVISSRQINQIYSIDGRNNGGRTNHSITAYRLAILLLTATRWMTSFTLGISAWIRMARVENGGSLYGYVVGLLAGVIGWTILGAAEGTLSNIVDACLICVASDNTAGQYCDEAQSAFRG